MAEEFDTWSRKQEIQWSSDVEKMFAFALFQQKEEVFVFFNVHTAQGVTQNIVLASAAPPNADVGFFSWSFGKLKHKERKQLSFLKKLCLVAFANDNCEIVKFLVDRKEIGWGTVISGEEFLLQLVSENKIQTLKCLYETPYGRTFDFPRYSWIAAEHGHLELLKWFFAIGSAWISDDVYMEEIACKHNHSSIVLWLKIRRVLRHFSSHRYVFCDDRMKEELSSKMSLLETI